MQLLIAHRDAEIGEQLVQMVTDYTSHDCELVDGAAGALEWGRRHARCTLLITQLEAAGLDGLGLGGSLSEIFPGLQTLFLPPYPATDQRLEVADTKVFPEPIDGEALLAAIGRAETANEGAPDLFHVADVLQMCCLSRRSGALQMVKEKKSGIIFLHHGAIVHAETTAARGRDAFFEIASWEYVEFAYDRTVRPPVETITNTWDEILVESVERRKEEKAQREERRRA
ncbi:MAG: Response regulator receiver protein [Spartobacteria bacterium]|nr:Response regulator receiver protein [Spartobacteria bacterium]